LLSLLFDFLFLCGIDAMTEVERTRQIADLRAMQHSDPRGLIAEYCRMTGEYSGNQMPRGASFSRMIEKIVEMRAATHEPTVRQDGALN